MPDITYDVGRVSFLMKGAWSIATAYEKLDAVTDNGNLYIAKQDVPAGTAITNTTYWVLAVTKGDQGATGNGIASITKTGTVGNVDTYTITYTDGTTTTFTVTNGGVATVNGRAGDVTGLAEEDGSYPLLNAGTSDNWTPYSADSGATQDIPFINEGTGCGNGESVVDTGSYLQFKKKLGNTVCVNQLCDIVDGTQTGAGNKLNTHTTDFFTDRYYLFMVRAVFPSTPTSQGGSGFPSNPVLLGFWKGTSYRRYQFAYSSSGVYIAIAKGSSLAGQMSNMADTTITLQMFPNAGETVTFSSVRVIDLTLWFGSNDAIPAHLLSHPEDWGRYYAGSLAYNAGTLESADGTVLRSIGRNVWDEEWELGYIGSESGSNLPSTTQFRSKNYISVIPNTQYYVKGSALNLRFYDRNKNFLSQYNASVSNTDITVGSDVFFMRFYLQGATYNHDITISLYYSGESGYDTYYPYTVLAEVDTGSEVLRGVEGSRDEKLPSGAITRNRAVVDLGTLNWAKGTGSNGYFYAELSGMKQQTGAAQLFSGISGKYVATLSRTNADWNSTTNEDKVIGTRHTTNYVCIVDSAFASYSGAQVATALSGVMLEYPLATPTTEQGTPFAENIPCDDFGSLSWTQTKGIPQGNEIFYPVDYKASFDTLYNIVDGDMSALATDDELQVVADRIPAAPDADGTYTLKATVSSGTKTYAWVAE